MFCSWENSLPVVLRQFQNRWVRSRAQTTAFECVEYRIATFSHADVHMCRPLICRKVPGTLQNPVFSWFPWKPGFGVGGGSLGHQVSGESPTPHPTWVCALERREELCRHENLEHICKMSDSERFSKFMHNSSCKVPRKHRNLWNPRTPRYHRFPR